MAKTVAKFISPKAIARFCWCEKPDTFGDRPKYKLTISIPKGDEKFDAVVRNILAEHKKVKGKADKAPIKDGDRLAEDNEKAERDRGHWVLTPKTSEKPVCVGPDGKTVLKKAAQNGDLVKVAVGAALYEYRGKDGKQAPQAGVTLYLNKVQVLERRAEDNPFDDESGDYNVADDDHAAGSGGDFDDEGGSSDSDDADGDY